MGKFFKTAVSSLLPHQEDALRKLDGVNSILLYHGMGSGKTLTALEAFHIFLIISPLKRKNIH